MILLVTKCYSGDQKEDGMVYVTRMGERRKAHRVLAVKPDGKSPLGRHRYV